MSKKKEKEQGQPAVKDKDVQIRNPHRAQLVRTFLKREGQEREVSVLPKAIISAKESELTPVTKQQVARKHLQLLDAS